MGHCCCLPFTRYRKNKRRIVLLLAGLDNAGKSTAAKGLAGVSGDPVIPTVGFSSIQLTHKGFSVIIYDVGGGPQIRAIWSSYFGDVHGIIFVIDSSDDSRIEESRVELEKMLLHEKIAGKPVLLLANKQDLPGAMDEIDVVERLCLERLVNEQKCPTLVEVCSAVPPEGDGTDSGLLSGYRWIVGYIIKNFTALNGRVEEDRKRERERVARAREAWRRAQARDLDDLSLRSQENGVRNFFRPIDEVVRDKEAKEEAPRANGIKAGVVLEVEALVNGNEGRASPGVANGHLPNAPQTPDFASGIRDQLSRKETLQRKKNGPRGRRNRVSPQRGGGLPPLVLPGAARGLGEEVPAQAKALAALMALPPPPVEAFPLPPIITNPLRPVTSRSLGNEGRAWGLSESLEVVLPPRVEEGETKKREASNEDITNEETSKAAD